MRNGSRRCLAVLLILAHLAGTVGLPLPAPRATEEQAEATGVHRCGCPVEKQAARTCCCSASGGGSCCSGGGAEPEDDSLVQWSGGVLAAHCQGDPPALLIGSAVAVSPPDAPDWRTDPSLTATLPREGERASLLPHSPPDPPPRTFPG